MNFKFLVKILATVCVLTMLLGTTYAASTRFNDLNGYSWAEEYIDALAERGVISGTSQDTFAPGNNVKREEFVKVIVNLFGYDTTDSTCNFTDVKTTDWHYKYVAAATKAGIINGVGDNKFGTGSNITRQDICVILYRVLNDKGYTVNETKTDSMNFDDLSDISDYAKEAVEKLYKAEIINGMDAKHFAPKSFATRAQMAKLAYLCDSKKIKKTEGSEGEKITESVEEVKVSKIRFENDTLNLYIGESKKNTPTIEPSSLSNVKLVWKSNNLTIASVNGDGTVTGLSSGYAIISAATEDRKKSSSYLVKVKKAPVPVTDVYINEPKIDLAVGETTILNVTILPTNASNKKLIWSSNNESVATVDDGRIKAIAPGTTIISATSDDGGKTVNCRVTVSNAVIHVEKITLNQTNLTLSVGQSFTLIPIISPTNATNKEVTWESKKENIVTVNVAGIVKAVSPGTGRIIAKSKDGQKNAACVITVVEN